jgi:FkbM family methyltransferase
MAAAMPFIVPLPLTDRTLDVINGRDTTVQRHLRRGGLVGFEPATQVTLCMICDRLPSITLYDVGAHIGFYSAYVGVLFGNKVAGGLAFEPTPTTADILEKVRERNGLNYELIRSAVSDHVGEVELFISPKSEASNSLNQAFRHASKSVRVPVTTIDTVVSSGKTPPNVIKIDVETHEPFVIMGARNTIERHRPFILFEVLAKADQAKFREVGELARRCDYSLYEIGKPPPWKPVKMALLGSPSAGSRQWFLSPRRLGEEDWAVATRYFGAISSKDESQNRGDAGAAFT